MPWSSECEADHREIAVEHGGVGAGRRGPQMIISIEMASYNMSGIV